MAIGRGSFVSQVLFGPLGHGLGITDKVLDRCLTYFKLIQLIIYILLVHVNLPRLGSQLAPAWGKLTFFGYVVIF